MAKVLMIQGTTSNAGKSWLTAGLCRLFRQEGYRVAPFKAQNMALNSYITADGLEMGRAQVMQAEAAGIAPDVLMNPILLKPTTDTGSQVIILGKVQGHMSARDYFAYKRQLIPVVKQAYQTLAEQYGLIVIEGAGSPAEINLKENDLVNMGMAAMADAPVLLVADIDRGGVFASLVGTIMLLEPEERARVKGLIINKFRGDADILQPGIGMIEEITGIPVVGVIPWLSLELDDEDSLSQRLTQSRGEAECDIAVIRLPRISNFTDFNPLMDVPEVGLRYVHQVEDLGHPDCIILPGTKNTMGDLLWLRQSGLAKAIIDLANQGCRVLGICGGYQMLGQQIDDPDQLEHGGSMAGLGLLPTETVFHADKVQTQVEGVITADNGHWSCWQGAAFRGYEIHLGQTSITEKEGQAMTMIGQQLGKTVQLADGLVAGKIAGTYIHGLFETKESVEGFLQQLYADKGISGTISGLDYRAEQDKQYDLLADCLRKHMDMEAVGAMLAAQEQQVEQQQTLPPVEQLLPMEIEQRSFAIIEQELQRRHIILSGETAPVIKRVIHTTADFTYAQQLYFSPQVIAQAITAIGSGAPIITDTTMAQAGINKSAAAKFGNSLYCFIGDDDVAEQAKARGMTRSAVSMEKAAALNIPAIFVIGNAPTALIRLTQLLSKGLRPLLVIGVPVGFVHVIEAKDMLLAAGVPCIVAKGRKGGSNVAAAICNALFYLAGGRDKEGKS